MKKLAPKRAFIVYKHNNYKKCVQSNSTTSEYKPQTMEHT